MLLPCCRTTRFHLQPKAVCNSLKTKNKKTNGGKGQKKEKKRKKKKKKGKEIWGHTAIGLKVQNGLFDSKEEHLESRTTTTTGGLWATPGRCLRPTFVAIAGIDDAEAG